MSCCTAKGALHTHISMVRYCTEHLKALLCCGKIFNASSQNTYLHMYVKCGAHVLLLRNNIFVAVIVLSIRKKIIYYFNISTLSHIIRFPWKFHFGRVANKILQPLSDKWGILVLRKEHELQIFENKFFVDNEKLSCFL